MTRTTTFSRALTEVMTSSGVSNQSLASRMHVDRSTISRWRSGRVRPERPTVERLDRELSASARLVRAWQVDETGSEHPHWRQRTPYFESAAQVIELASPHMVHGMLQSPQYARFMLRAALYQGTDADMEQEVRRRCGHHAWLAENGNPWIVAAFPAVALTCLPGAVRRDQAGRLLSLIDGARVTVHLIGDHTPIGIPSMLTVYHLRDGSTAAASEHNRGVVIHEQATSVGRMAELFKRVLASAMPQAESRGLLEEMTR